MKESILHNVVRCSKCGEHYYKCRGVSDTRCESCFDDADLKPEAKHWEDVEHEAQAEKGS